MPQSVKKKKLRIGKFNPEILRYRLAKGYCPTIVVLGKRGTGKSNGYNTPVVMSDGSLKMIQDVKIGNQLMGDDSKPRTVISTSKAKEPLFRVKQKSGDDYIVNADHILSLMIVSTNTPEKPINLQGKQFYRGDTIDISVKDYLKLSKTTRQANLKGYKVSVEFHEKLQTIDPYIIGAWLGDGASSGLGFTNKDSAVLKYLSDKLPEYNCYLKRKESAEYGYYFHTTKPKEKGLHVNGLLDSFKELNLINNKHIPQIYKTGSRGQRLELLAGLLDTDGTLDWANNFEITQKNYKLAKDIEFVARSLGFKCNIKECNKSCQTGATGIYYRMHITGKGIDQIPCKIPRKQARPYKQNKFSLCTGIDIQPVDQSYYDQGEEYHYRYSIQIDGNQRYLLGDFTVTHNSTLVSDLLYYLKDHLPMVVTMSGSEDGNHFYRQYSHPALIHGQYKPEIVNSMIKKQKEKLNKCDQHGIDPTTRPDLNVGFLLDDCGYKGRKIMGSEDMAQIFQNGRHLKVITIISLQYMMGLPPEARTNIDYVFALRENIVSNQRKLFDNFFGVFPKFAQFQETFAECTNNYECLVLDNNSNSTNVTKCVYWWKATPDRKFKIGSPQLWEYLNSRYDPRRNNNDEDDNIGPERNSGIAVSKGPMVEINNPRNQSQPSQVTGNNNNYNYPQKDHRDQYHKRR